MAALRLSHHNGQARGMLTCGKKHEGLRGGAPVQSGAEAPGTRSPNAPAPSCAWGCHQRAASRSLRWVSPLLEACLPQERQASRGAQREERARSAGGGFLQALGFGWSPTEAGCGGKPCCVVRFRPLGFAWCKVLIPSEI